MRNLVLILFLSFFFGKSAYCYDDVRTHRDLTDKALSASALNSYLKNGLGFAEGTFSLLGGNTINWWLREGSYLEDTHKCRASNHFHNPGKTWNDSYMSDDTTPLGLGIRLYCEAQGWSYFSRKSDVTWATGFLSPAPSGSKATFSTNPKYAPYNWDKARADYYSALTSPSSTVRESKVADTFSTLGHVMHLLQDMAVPAHTRNDFTSHLRKDPVYGVIQPYENYVKIFPSLVNIADPTGNFPTFSSLTVTKYWDTDQYAGSNPSAATTIGLAEYANANFFSDSTILKDISDQEHWFPYPALSGVQEFDEVVDTNSGKKRTYLRKIGDGETVNHLAAGSWGYKFLPSPLKNMGLFLDDKCHDDYARKLLPRAVGYSAGLLDYFFRGSIDITVPSDGVYSMIDTTQPGFDPETTDFTSIKLRAKNMTANTEEMTNGTIQLVVKYKVAHTDPFQSGPVETDAEFSYIVVPEKNGVSSLSRSAYTELNFDLSEHPISLWATDVYLQVVYKGTLGNEENAVAVGFKDIGEPTPMDMFNNMDMICLYDTWYVAGSQDAIDRVDTNQNGQADEWDVFAHDLTNVYMRILPFGTAQYASPSVHNIAVPSLLAGQFLRAAYFLSDYQYYFGDYSTVTAPDANDHRSHSYRRALFSGESIRRQRDYTEGSGYVDNNPQFVTFRGLTVWGSGEVWDNAAPAGSACLYVDLP